MLYQAVCILLSFFFFFQAEDGIRDGHVTGVQTCALPISPGTLSAREHYQTMFREWLVDVHRVPASYPYRCPCRGRDPGCPARSEERRVGKECRSRWSAYQ